MKSLSVSLTAVSACLAASVAYGANGVTLTQKTTTDGQTETHQVQIDQHHIRAEMGGGPRGSQVVIFDGTQQVMDIVNPANKTYMEMTKADIDRISSQVSGAMAQMQAAMANMTPEQRAQMEAMMKGRGMPGMGSAAAAPPKPVYKKVGTDKVGKWTCDKYEGYENGQKTSEVCTVDPSALGLSMSDFAVTQDMAQFMSGLTKMMPSARNMFTVGTLENQGYAGVPVRTTQTVMGHTVTSEITDINRGDVPATAFQVPSGYEKQPMMGMGRGR